MGFQAHIESQQDTCRVLQMPMLTVFKKKKKTNSTVRYAPTNYLCHPSLLLMQKNAPGKLVFFSIGSLMQQLVSVHHSLIIAHEQKCSLRNTMFLVALVRGE